MDPAFTGSKTKPVEILVRCSVRSLAWRITRSGDLPLLQTVTFLSKSLTSLLDCQLFCQHLRTLLQFEHMLAPGVRTNAARQCYNGHRQKNSNCTHNRYV